MLSSNLKYLLLLDRLVEFICQQFHLRLSSNLRLLWFHTGATNTSGSAADIIKVTQFEFQHFYFVLHGCSRVLYVTLHGNIAFENLVLIILAILKEAKQAIY